MIELNRDRIAQEVSCAMKVERYKGYCSYYNRTEIKSIVKHLGIVGIYSIALQYIEHKLHYEGNYKGNKKYLKEIMPYVFKNRNAIKVDLRKEIKEIKL